MPEGLAAALEVPGLWWLIGATYVAGLVRGFAGFGTAMIYLPIAATVLPPVWAIITLVVFDIFGPAVLVPRVIRDVHLPDLGRLVLGVAAGLPIGLMVLYSVAPEVFRYVVSGLTLVLLLLLISGLRYQGRMTPGLVLGSGALGGMLGGSAGVPGPPVILLYLASPLPAAVVRATVTLYLLSYDVLLLGIFAGMGRLEAVPVWLGVLLAVPNALGNWSGAAIFRPGQEAVYRWVAYAIIGAAALSGLPIWSE